MKIYWITFPTSRQILLFLTLILLVTISTSGVHSENKKSIVNDDLNLNQNTGSATIFDFFISTITSGEHLAQMVIYINHTNTVGHLNITFEFVQNDVSLEVMDVLVLADGTGSIEVRALISPRVSGFMNVTATVYYDNLVQDTFKWLWENPDPANPGKLRAFVVTDQLDLDNNGRTDTVHTRLYYSYFNTVNTNVTVTLRIYRFGYPNTFNGVISTRNHTGNGNDVVSFNLTASEDANYQFEWDYLADGVHVDWVTEEYVILKYWGYLGTHEIKHNFNQSDHVVDDVARSCSDTYTHKTTMNYTQSVIDKFMLGVNIIVFDETKNDYTTGTGKGKNFLTTSENGSWSFEVEFVTDTAGKYRIRTTIDMFIGTQTAQEYMHDIFIDNRDECVFASDTSSTSSSDTDTGSTTSTTISNTEVTTTPVSDNSDAIDSSQNDKGASVSLNVQFSIISFVTLIFTTKKKKSFNK